MNNLGSLGRYMSGFVNPCASSYYGVENRSILEALGVSLEDFSVRILLDVGFVLQMGTIKSLLIAGR